MELDRLADASTAELAEFLRQRFQMQGPMAADMGTRREELPYDLPLELWKAADGAHKRDIIQATRELLQEVPGRGWTADAVEWLVSFIDFAGMAEVGDALLDAVESGRWLAATDDGPRCHMLALRTLLGLNWKGTHAVWTELPPSVSRRYPGLVFRGLLAQQPERMDVAFNHLPTLVADEPAVRRIIDVLSPVVRKVGAETVRGKLLAVCDRLPPHLVAEFDRWFTIHKWGSIHAPRACDIPWNDRAKGRVQLAIVERTI